MENNVMPSLALCVTVGDDLEGLKRLLNHMRGYVDKTIVTVLPGNDEVLSAAAELVDEVIVGEQEHAAQIEFSYPKMFTAAKTDYVLILETNETLDHPERLREFASKKYDAIFFPLRIWISGYQSKVFGLHNFRLGMLKPDKIKWEDRFLDEWAMEEKEEYIRTCRCWINHYATIGKIKERSIISKPITVEGESEEDVPTTSRDYVAAIEQEQIRRSSRGNKIRILLSYGDEVGIGDTLTTTPVVREIRKRYPEAEITYRTKNLDTLGKGKQLGENLYQCIHPAIDFMDTTQFIETSAKMERFDADFDLVVHWEDSRTVKERVSLNTYELESAWAGFEPADGNYKPDWTFAKDEEKFGQKWIKKHCRTKRCVGLVMTTNGWGRLWPFMEDWVNAMLERYPDVSIMAFGLLEKEYVKALFLRRMYGVRPDVLKSADDIGKPDWYDPKRFIQCGAIAPDALKRIPRRFRKMGLNLRQMASVFPYLDLLVTPDTGPLHIAAALETPTVACFTSVPSELRIKHFPWITAVSANFECSPCYWDINCRKATKEGAPCARTISTRKMMEEVGRRLEEVSGSKKGR